MKIKTVLRVLLLLFLSILSFISLQSEPDKKSQAIELNKKGYYLYVEGKYSESLEYFKKSFETDPELIYPHYNYACVLSLLHRDDQLLEIWEHLLTAFHLGPDFRIKALSDPDLNWFLDRKYSNPFNQENDHPLAFNFRNYDPFYDKTIVRNHISDKFFTLGYDDGAMVHLTELYFTANNVVYTIEDGEKTYGSYEISGNMIYVTLDEEVNISMYKDMEIAWLSRRFIFYYNKSTGNFYPYDLNGWQFDYFREGRKNEEEQDFGA